MLRDWGLRRSFCWERRGGVPDRAQRSSTTFKLYARLARGVSFTYAGADLPLEESSRVHASSRCGFNLLPRCILRLRGSHGRDHCHRGASWDAPENTVAAIKLAWEQGADGSEFDVHLTKDGKLIGHPRCRYQAGGRQRREGRRADVGRVAEARCREVERRIIRRRKASDARGDVGHDPIRQRVFIELKTGPEIVPELDRVLRASQRKPEETPVIAFNAETIAAVKKARPDLRAYWLVGLKEKGKETRTAAELIAKAKKIHANGLDLSAATSLDKDFADQVKAAGLKLYVWTVNDPAVASAHGRYWRRRHHYRPPLVAAAATGEVITFSASVHFSLSESPTSWPSKPASEWIIGRRRRSPVVLITDDLRHAGGRATGHRL